MISLQPVSGLWLALLCSVIIALAKEAWDVFIEKDNNKEQVIHDLICDGVGLLCSLITILIWVL